MSKESCNTARVLIVQNDQTYAERVIAPHFEEDWRVSIAYDVRQSLRAVDDIVDLRLAIVELDIPGGVQDIKVSGGAGFEVMKVLQAKYPQVRIVILTRHSAPMLINRAQHMGVEYIVKGECSANLRKIGSDLLIAHLDGSDEPAIAAARELAVASKLSPKQSEVLVMLLRDFSRQEIMQELDITAWTLKGHIRETLRRTGFGRTQALLRSLRKAAKG